MSISLRWGPATSTPDALVISNIAEDQLTEISVRVSWDVSEVAQGWIQYGTTNGGPYPFETTHETSFNYSHHVQTISGLAEDTDYYYRIVAVAQSGVTAFSTQGTFTTDTSAAPPPGVTYHDYIIPTSYGGFTIDSTGAADSWQGIQAFIDSVPSGASTTDRSRIRASSPTAVYRCTRGPRFAGKSHLDFDGLGTGGSGATIRAHPTTYDVGGTGGIIYTSNIVVGIGAVNFSPQMPCTDIKIHGWQLFGNGSASTPVLQGEGQANIFVGPCNGIEIYDIRADGARGDFLDVAGYGAFNGHVHDVTNVRCERNFLTFDYAEDWLVEDFAAGISAYYFCDIEVGGAGRQIKRITVKDGTTQGWDAKLGSYGGGFIAAFNQTVAPAGEDVVFDNITGIGTNPRNTIQSYIGGGTTQRINGFTISDCTFPASLSNGPGVNLTLNALRIRNVDNLTLTGNTQPGAAGPGSWWEPGSPQSCTNIVKSGNTPPIP